jgi:hypothetical protein
MACLQQSGTMNESRIVNLFPMQTRVKALCAGIVAALVAFVPLLALFDWALITYWKWQHEGRRMKFTFWADERALLSALSLCALVFCASVRYLQRHAPLDQRIKRRSLVIGVVVVYLSIAVYVFMVFSRFASSR